MVTLLIYGPEQRSVELFIKHLNKKHSFHHLKYKQEYKDFHIDLGHLNLNDDDNANGLSVASEFTSLDQLTDHVTKRWTEHMVIQIEDIDVLLRDDSKMPLLKRPFVLTTLIMSSNNSTSFDCRVARLLHQSTNLCIHFSAKVGLECSVNDYYNDTMACSDCHLSIPYLETRLVRPSWDIYFMRLAHLASTRSNCMKRRVGAILVNSHSHSIISTGYNGTPRGMPNCNGSNNNGGIGGCVRCNSGDAKCGEGFEICVCLHAEENALLCAARENSKSLHGESTLYCTTAPCVPCAVKIVQAEIKRVVYAQLYSPRHDSESLLKSAGVEVCKLADHEARLFIEVNELALL